MPRYLGLLELEDTGPDVPEVFLFDYCSGEDQPEQTLPRSWYRKQLVALDSCLFVNQIPGEKEESKGSQSGNDKDREGPAVNGHGEGGEQDKEQKTRATSPLQKGQEFEGSFLKCPNSPYDYALKIWDQGKENPKEVSCPKEGEEVSGLVVDRNGDFLTIACGPNIAYATKKSFLFAGVDPDDLSLPFARLRVSLSKAETSPPEVPAAAWVAHPTQVVVPPYDIY